MSDDNKMTIDERLKYLRRMKGRYLKADRQERGRLLDEMEIVTELHRKSLIRLLSTSLERTPRRRQRSRCYGPEVDDALRVIAESLDYVCPERLTPNLSWLAQHLAKQGEIESSPTVMAQLDQISVSTVRRIMSRIRQDEPLLPRRGPHTANSVTRDVPMRRIPWNEQVPGHFEVDLVHHCGLSASGEYVCTIQMIDVATGWSERRAVLGRSYLVMKDAFLCILARLPFPVVEIHPDNGSEFFNHHMRAFWKDTLGLFELSRSRPYHKNDNRFVEQKNSTLVRAYVGYERFDTVDQTLALNHIYDKTWPYYNFFQPVMRLSEKIPICEAGRMTRVQRRYDQARTPLDRLCATTAISEEQQQRLRSLQEHTNPRQLRYQIHDLLDELFSLPCAAPGVAQNAYDTLTYDPFEVDDLQCLLLRMPSVVNPFKDP